MKFPNIKIFKKPPGWIQVFSKTETDIEAEKILKELGEDHTCKTR